MKNIIALLVLAGIFKAGESAVSEWTKPVIGTPEGSGTLTEKINHGVTDGDTTGITIEATAGDGESVEYAIVSQDPTSPVLAINGNSGDVTVTSGTIDYSSVTSFTLEVTGKVGDDVKAVTVTLNVNAAPSFSSHSSTVCILDGATEGTDLIALTATDANTGDTITYAIASGNTNNDFAITSTGVVEVATGKTLDMTTTNSYTLEITATDGSSIPLIATTTVTATVSSTCPPDSGAAALAVTFMTVLSALIISLQ